MTFIVKSTAMLYQGRVSSFRSESRGSSAVHAINDIPGDSKKCHGLIAP